MNNNNSLESESTLEIYSTIQNSRLNVFSTCESECMRKVLKTETRNVQPDLISVIHIGTLGDFAGRYGLLTF